MRNTKPVPKFETICKSIWSEDCGFTEAEWEEAGYNVKEAVARTIADPVVRKAFDAQVAKLLANNSFEWWFYPENLAVDVCAALPKKHWVSVAGIKCFDLHYPEGM